jgi:azurin
MKLLPGVLAAALAIGALGASFAAPADPCRLEISGNDVMQYDRQELSVPGSCKDITVTLHHVGHQPREAMGHNWVLVNAADLAAVANAGLSAGLVNDYVAPGDKRVLAHTRVIGGGDSASVSFPASALKKGGDYRFLCTFPGHSALMHGTFRIG